MRRTCLLTWGYSISWIGLDYGFDFMIEQQLLLLLWNWHDCVDICRVQREIIPCWCFLALAQMQSGSTWILVWVHKYTMSCTWERRHRFCWMFFSLSSSMMNLNVLLCTWVRGLRQHVWSKGWNCKGEREEDGDRFILFDSAAMMMYVFPLTLLQLSGF